MNPEQLRKKISYSLNEGFTEKEIRQVLRQQGVKHSQINQALNQVKSQGNDQDISTSSSKEDKESQNTQNYEEKFNKKKRELQTEGSEPE